VAIPPIRTRFEISWLEDRSDDGLLAELRRVASLMPDRPLTADAFNAHARIGASAVERRFGSWSAAKKRAGLVDDRPDYSDDAICADLKRVSASDLEGSFTHQFYSAHGGLYSKSLFQRRFGGWREALDTAGIADRHVGPSISERMRAQPGRSVSDEDLLKQIRDLAARLGKDTLTGVEIASNTVNGDLIWARFGSIKEALRLAGVQQSKRGRRYTEDEAFRNMFETWIHYGRSPTHSEMDRPPSMVGSSTYINRYGGWRKALKAFVQRANSEADGDLGLSPLPEPSSMADLSEVPEVSVKSSHVLIRKQSRRTRKTRPLATNTAPLEARTPSIGLRFRVFQRDLFRCRFCGRSTATEATCVLHVDHIIPFSKGGKTTLENLQLLCAECNVGKSNRSV